jgi:hypothetical protein
MVPIHRSRYIVAGLVDSTLTFLDSHTHLSLHNWRASSSLGITVKVVTTNPAETLIATGFSNGSVSLLESRTGTLIGNWRASDSEITQVRSFAFAESRVVPSFSTRKLAVYHSFVRVLCPFVDEILYE